MDKNDEYESDSMKEYLEEVYCYISSDLDFPYPVKSSSDKIIATPDDWLDTLLWINKL